MCKCAGANGFSKIRKASKLFVTRRSLRENGEFCIIKETKILNNSQFAKELMGVGTIMEHILVVDAEAFFGDVTTCRCLIEKAKIVLSNTIVIASGAVFAD